MPTTGTIPLTLQIPGNLIAASLWNTEFQNVGNLMDPVGVGSYSVTGAQMQIQTAPYPGSVQSLATSLSGEIERIRFMLAQLGGVTLWYQSAPTNLNAVNGILIPIGGSFMYSVGTTPPSSNFALMNGQALSRTVYATLFGLIGTSYGAGDGSTTFNIPNMYDKFPIGAGNLYSLAQTGGATTHTLTSPELPAVGLGVNITDPGHNHTQNAHNHGVTDPGHSHSIYFSTGVGPSNYPNPNGSVQNANPTSSNTTGISVANAVATNNISTTGISATTTAMGSGSAHSILNPFIGVFWMMRIV